jgi:hypothetical protein
MERGFVSAIAMNGAGIIHDFEIALSGRTSEDVDESLGPGQFGMAAETAQLNDVIAARCRGGPGHRSGGRRAPGGARSAVRRDSLAAAAHRSASR